jgi:putative transposase
LSQVYKESTIRLRQENFIESGLYHLYNRSVDNELLFRSAEDYILFLKKFKLIIIDVPVTVFAYYLMPNHFHFLLRQESELAANHIFNHLFSFYSQKYNRKYRRRGKLLGSKLQHKAIINEDYLIYLCQYIHCNPVKAGLCSAPEDWEFSNYKEWLGLRKGTLFSNEILLNHFRSPAEYQATIYEYEKFLGVEPFLSLLIDNKY